MSGLAAAAALGLALGVVTGMPLGVINVAIVDAALAGEARFARGLGLGGALADTVHAAIAFAGVGRIVTGHPAWTRGLALIAAGVIVGYALVRWRRRHAPRTRAGGHGVVAGFAMTVVNPGALAAWVAVASAVWPTISIAAAGVLAAGVGAGSALWFSLLSRWIAALPAGHAAARVVPRVALGLLVALAAVGIARAF